MSYFLSTTQPDKATAFADLLRQFDQQVVPMFPLHAGDRAAVQANLNAALGVMASDDSRPVAATISGFIITENGAITNVGISATCSHATVPVTAAPSTATSAQSAAAPAAVIGLETVVAG